jgi:hypothetical protein
MCFSLASTNASEPFGMPMEARVTLTKSPVFIDYLQQVYATSIWFPSIYPDNPSTVLTIKSSHDSLPSGCALSLYQITDFH